MVRSVKHCSVCCLKFVSFGGRGNLRCLNCSPDTIQDKTEQINFSRPDDDDHDKDVVEEESEGGDDCKVVEAEKGRIHYGNDPKENKNSSSRVTSMRKTTDDICFICGVSLSKIKHRVAHFKRCQKKFGITGKDVRTVEYASTSNNDDDKEDTNNASDNNWHGDAEKMLINDKHEGFYDAEASRNFPSTINVSRGNCTRNLNNVLMAGSRRLEIIAKATKNRGDTNEKRGNKRARFSSTKESWRCPLYKKITSTDFVVDGFHYAKASLTSNYFLSHYHSDHYGGISSSWDAGTIYCSLPTAKLVSQQLRVNKKFLHPLELNQATVILSRGKPITVTLLDANHCPGAVMFFFEVGKRNVLHVGDFRWSNDVMLQNSSSPLRKIASQKIKLDELYLDTTYCNEKYLLPSQAAAIKVTITTFGKEHESGERTLHLFGAYTIGKEKVYLSVAKYFGLKVYVDKARYKILSALELPNESMQLLTTNKEDAKLWVVPMSHLNMKKMPEYLSLANSKPFAPSYTRICGYRPSGWSFSASGFVSSRRCGSLVIHSVPYSEHSSFPELLDCLACLKPARIVPTVKATQSNEQVKMLLNGLKNRQTQLRFGL